MRRLMPYRIRCSNNLVVELDTADEFRDALRVLRTPDAATRRTRLRRQRFGDRRSRWDALMALLARGPHRLRLLALVHAHSPAGISRQDVARALGVSAASAVNGMVASLAKCASKVGIDVADVLTTATGTYAAGPMLLEFGAPSIDAPPPARSVAMTS